jgi:hypothetical protein
VLTHDDSEVTIIEIMIKTLDNEHNNYPFIVTKEFMGTDQEIYLSPNHGILINNLIVPIKYTNLLKKNDLDEILYYNLKLQNYFKDTIVAGGLICESWDGINQELFGPKKEFEEKYKSFLQYKTLVVEGEKGRLFIQDNFRNLET